MRRGRGSSAAAPQPLFARGPHLVAPVRKRHFVALLRSAYRLLGTPAQGFEETADMGRVVHHAKFHPYHLGDACAGPDLAAEPISGGAAMQQGGQMRELLGGESARGTRRGAVLEGIRAAHAGSLHPLADGGFADP
jgi:hypothetical protein